MQLNAYSTILSPLVALAAVAFIVLLMRWVFSTSHRDQRAAQQAVRAATVPGDFGLLVPVSTARTAPEAEQLRGVLAAAGVRGTVAATPAGELALLVFPTDAARARQALVSR